MLPPIATLRADALSAGVVAVPDAILNESLTPDAEDKTNANDDVQSYVDAQLKKLEIKLEQESYDRGVRLSQSIEDLRVQIGQFADAENFNRLLRRIKNHDEDIFALNYAVLGYGRPAIDRDTGHFVAEEALGPIFARVGLDARVAAVEKRIDELLTETPKVEVLKN